MLPKTSGLGLKPEHFSTILAELPDIGWFEVHPENYMGDGGPLHKFLTQIRSHYTLSMHGVGLSLGSTQGISLTHLEKLKKVVDRYQPAQVSEHLSWSHWNQVFLHDLLPLPYTDESMEVICQNIDRVQSYLQREILIENPSTYIDFRNSEYSEAEFLNLVSVKSGCGILLDINNIYVSSHNHNFDPARYLETISPEKVGEIHLAGHAVVPLTEEKSIRIDDHGSAVCPEVWDLFQSFIKQVKKPMPILIEWDTHIPEFDVLEQEARKSQVIVDTIIEHEKSIGAVK